MSDDVIARRARALEELLGSGMRFADPAIGGPEPTGESAPPESPTSDSGEAAAEPDAAEPDAAEPEPTRSTADGQADPVIADSITAPVVADQVDAVVADDPHESMMVARIGALLGHPGTWQAPASLPEALLAELRAQAVRPETAADAGPSPEPAAAAEPGVAAPADVPPAAATSRRWWPRLRWTPPRLALGLAGGLAALLLIVVVFGGDLLRPSERQVADIQLAGTSAAPQAHARMRAIERDAGWRLVLDVDGLAPAQADEYYQGWAVHDQELVPLGTFHMHKQGQVELWSGVPLKKFSRIEVTEQRIGAGQAPGVLVMVGQI